MDDVAALNDVTGPAVVDNLKQRYQQQQYDTWLGDFLLTFNPIHNANHNDSELGHWYRKRKPMEELPPHVMAVAHRAYRMLHNDVMPQAIVIAGRAASGKTEASKVLVSQLLREARLSPVSGLGPKIVMAQHVLQALHNARTRTHDRSTRAVMMTSLYFGTDGQLAKAEFEALCRDKWYLVHRKPGCAPFNIFYAMLAGMTDHEMQLYYLVDKYRLLNTQDQSPMFATQDDHTRDVDMFNFFVAALDHTGIDQQTWSYAGREMSAILAVLAAILHLANLDMTSQGGQPAVVNHHELRAASDLLGLESHHLEAEIMSTVTVIRGEVVRLTSTVEQSQWSRDVLVVELYTRLVAVITERLKHSLQSGGDSESPTHSMESLTPLYLVESVAHEDDGAGNLETFCRNMAGERLQHHLYDVVFQHDLDQCQTHKVPPYKIKYAGNTELIGLVFGPDYGIFNKIATVSRDPQASPEMLVSLMDSDPRVKKTGCYVSAGSKVVKNPDAFFIKHTAGQVTYSSRDFIVKNQSMLAESAKQLLASSVNPVVSAMANATEQQQARRVPDIPFPEAHFATDTFQSDLTYILKVLDTAHLHHIRCVRASDQMPRGSFDQQLVTVQLKESCVVEMARQRKFGYSLCLTHQQFLHRFGLLSSWSGVQPTGPQACNRVLQDAHLHGKGVTVTKQAVFLRYWHVHNLHAQKAQRMRRLTLVQAHVRGFLTRRRMRDMLTSLRRGRRQISSDVARRNRRSDVDEGFDARRHEPDYDDVQDDNDALSLFYEQAVGKVRMALNTLESGIWAKLIYMERGRQVARAYVQDKSIIVDSSRAVFDGERFGVGAFQTAMDEETAFYKHNIVEGVRLKRSNDGSILACRLCDQPVIVKGFSEHEGGTFLSEDVILCRGQLPFEQTIKIFDINEFRSKVALDLKQGQFSKVKLQRACVVSLSFGRDDVDGLMTPCWLCVINVKALAALESDSIVKEAQLQTAKLEMTSPEQEKERLVADEAKSRRSRGRWARTDQRDHLAEKEIGGRHMRKQLRAKDLSVGEHVGYSWNSAVEHTTMEQLQHMVDADTDSGQPRARWSGGAVREWAKIETAVRDQKTKSALKRPNSATAS